MWDWLVGLQSGNLVSFNQTWGHLPWCRSKCSPFGQHGLGVLCTLFSHISLDFKGRKSRCRVWRGSCDVFWPRVLIQPSGWACRYHPELCGVLQAGFSCRKTTWAEGITKHPSSHGDETQRDLLWSSQVTLS